MNTKSRMKEFAQKQIFDKLADLEEENRKDVGERFKGYIYSYSGGLLTEGEVFEYLKCDFNTYRELENSYREYKELIKNN